jgi:hypothetical protein
MQISRNNITLSQFLADVRWEAKRKGIDIHIDREEFERPSHPDCVSYYVKDRVCHYTSNGYVTHHPVEEGYDGPESEICNTQPYDQHIYIRHSDGSCYNWILEFNWWDEKT